MKKFLLLFTAVIIAMTGCKSDAPKKFEIKRGLNISHWLSQSRATTEQRAAYFVEEDMAKIAADGFDHVRLPVDETSMWTADHEKIEGNWQLLKNGLDWAMKYNLKVIVDLHSLRSHSFIVAPGHSNPLFSEPEAQEWLVEMWRQLGAFMKEYPTDMLAYEFMNEPVADNPEDWNKLIMKVHDSIRETEPTRYLVIGSNQQQSIFTFGDLRLPENDPYLILSFHYYHPMFLTHHKASWTVYRNIPSECHYPGVMITPEDYEALDDNGKQVMADFTKEWNRDMMVELIRPCIEKAKEYGIQVFCGEWGAINLAPRADAERWYSDMISIFDEFDVAWTAWDIKAEFGYWKPDGTIDEDFLKILTAGKGVEK